MIEEGRALFLQIAENIENTIVDGSLAEESRACLLYTSPSPRD